MNFQPIEGVTPRLNDILTFEKTGEGKVHVRVTGISSNGEFQGEIMPEREAMAELRLTERLSDLCWEAILKGRHAKYKAHHA